MAGSSVVVSEDVASRAASTSNAPYMLLTLWEFWRAVMSFVLRGNYCAAPACITKEPAPVRAHLYALALAFRMWGAPHYSSPATVGQEMRTQLAHVAIPGTGVPLSWACFSRFTFLFCVLAV